MNTLRLWLRLMQPTLVATALAATALVQAGCSIAPPRTSPLPQSLYEDSTILGLSDVRNWGDEAPQDIQHWYVAGEEEYRKRFSGIMATEHHYLALSGGGENGAFSAGLLSGWTASGERPQFTIVTGVSTGGLIAPYAFLGSDYDWAVTEVYTHYSAKDLVSKPGFFSLFRTDAVMESVPMKQIIDRYMTRDVMDKIALEHHKGRMLFIGTTNLDASRPVMWDIGRIAASEHPEALDLIRSIQLASASIPVGVPPVLFEVEAQGKRFDEMHVDGGVTQQVFLYPLGIDWPRVEERLQLPGKPRVYVVRNAMLESQWEVIDRKLFPIAERTISSLIRTQGIGDIYRMYLGARRDGLEFNLAYIPAEMSDTAPEKSGLEYMNHIYQQAFSLAKQGYPWESAPPGAELE